MNYALAKEQLFLITRIESNYKNFMIKTKGAVHSLELLYICKDMPKKK